MRLDKTVHAHGVSRSDVQTRHTRPHRTGRSAPGNGFQWVIGFFTCNLPHHAVGDDTSNLSGVAGSHPTLRPSLNPVRSLSGSERTVGLPLRDEGSVLLDEGCLTVDLPLTHHPSPRPTSEGEHSEREDRDGGTFRVREIDTGHQIRRVGREPPVD